MCSSHSWLPNGKLLVAGGHFKDRMGIDPTPGSRYRTVFHRAGSFLFANDARGRALRAGRLSVSTHGFSVSRYAMMSSRSSGLGTLMGIFVP
jgi:hypothetical protein